MSEGTYNTSGPECPFCHYVHGALEPWAYDENGGDVDCESCGKRFFMSPSCSWSWTCEAPQ